MAQVESSWCDSICTLQDLIEIYSGCVALCLTIDDDSCSRDDISADVRKLLCLVKRKMDAIILE